MSFVTGFINLIRSYEWKGVSEKGAREVVVLVVRGEADDPIVLGIPSL